MSSKNKWFFSLFLTALTALIMQTQGSALKTMVTPLGIVSLELAYSEVMVQQILAIWNHYQVMVNICLDFLFIPAYTFFFLVSLALMAKAHRVGFMQRLGNGLRVFAFGAAALDVVENTFMFFTISGTYSGFSLMATAGIAACKFFFIALIVFYLLISLPMVLFGEKKGIA